MALLPFIKHNTCKCTYFVVLIEAPSILLSKQCSNTSIIVEIDTEAPTYAMATEQLEDLEIVEETPPTMPTEQEPKKLSPAKKKPGPCNPDQAAEFVVETTQSVDNS